MNRRILRRLLQSSLCLALLSLASGSARAQSAGDGSAPDGEARLFQFKLDPGDTLSVDKYQYIRIFDGFNWISREEKNRIVLRVLERAENGDASLEGDFVTYSREPRQTGEFRRDRDFHSKFIIGVNGQYRVADAYTMPNLRSLPGFPDRALQPGERWTAPAMEVLDISSRRMSVPVEAEYQYLGQAPLTMPDGAVRQLDRIAYQYSYSAPSNLPGVRSVTGVSACQLWFDVAAGTPVFDANRLVYSFHMIDGSVQEFHFSIDSWWKKSRTATNEERSRIADEIRAGLQGAGEDIQVRAGDEGVTLELSDILFDHNSAQLSPQARQSLARIAEALQRYSDREVRISGHTDSTGNADYNLRLSEGRARSVVRALQQEFNVDPRRLSYRGYGETQPAASNSTPEGRQRNRRVEVLIVTD
ncbi:MAG: OmpA family protein [Leptospirales bacterium]|nr:OmpA family protein [Leptospirales bacterium]